MIGEWRPSSDWQKQNIELINFVSVLSFLLFFFYFVFGIDSTSTLFIIPLHFSFFLFKIYSFLVTLQFRLPGILLSAYSRLFFFRYLFHFCCVDLYLFPRHRHHIVGALASQRINCIDDSMMKLHKVKCVSIFLHCSVQVPCVFRYVESFFSLFWANERWTVIIK